MARLEPHHQDMSNYDNDDVLVPPGVRVLTRPGVTYIPAPPAAERPTGPPPPTPQPSPGGNPLPTIELHPLQPKATESAAGRIAVVPGPRVVVVTRRRAF